MVQAPRVLADHPRDFGFWGLNGRQSPEGLADLKARYGLTVFQTASADPDWVADKLLPLAQAAGVRVTLRLTGGHVRYTGRDGGFDLARWRAMLERHDPARLAPFIADGTLAGHMLLDDIYEFEGPAATGDDLDELARLSKAHLPGLPTYVREAAGALPVPSSGRYHHLDLSVSQYHHRRGDVVAYVQEHVAAADALGLGLIHGLNLPDGGDGRSKQPGWRSGHWAMSAAEIDDYGAVLADSDAYSMFLCWEYDAVERWSDGSIGSTWLDRPDIQAALAKLSQTVRDSPGPPLLREARRQAPAR